MLQGGVPRYSTKAIRFSSFTKYTLHMRTNTQLSQLSWYIKTFVKFTNFRKIKLYVLGGLDLQFMPLYKCNYRIVIYFMASQCACDLFGMQLIICKLTQLNSFCKDQALQSPFTCIINTNTRNSGPIIKLQKYGSSVLRQSIYYRSQKYIAHVDNSYFGMYSAKKAVYFFYRAYHTF